MSQINGIPIEIKVGNDIESPVFATARKCPGLLGKMKAINKADAVESGAARQHELAAQALDQATAEELKKAETALQKASDNALDASAAVMTAVHDFIVAGFLGAGYKAEDAERYTELLDMERVQEIKAKCLYGAGRVGFPKG